MTNILVYADSLSWGIIPMTRQRFTFDKRWPGILEITLNAEGKKVRVIEDCLNGRRTMYEDVIKAGRNGLVGLAQRIEVNSPLAWVLLMLGTNDFQANHEHTARDAALGIERIIEAIRTAPIEPGMPIPKIMVIAPPIMQSPKGDIAAKFKGAEQKSIGLAQAYAEVCKVYGCEFFDASTVTDSSHLDGVHLDADQHLRLGHALATKMLESL